MTDWGASGRHVSYSFHLVDPFTLAETGETLEVPGADAGSITWAWGSDNAYSAQSRALALCPRERLVRIRRRMSTGDVSRSDVLGTFFVDDVPANALHGSVERQLALYSTLWRHTQEELVFDWQRPAGYNIAEELRELVAADGGTLLLAADVDAERTHTVDVTFPMGTNKGKVLAQICEWAGWRLGCDEWGHVTVSADADPRGMAPAFTFEAGANCVYLPGVQITESTAEAYNRVHAYYSVKDATENLLVELPATHPFAKERIGRPRSYNMHIEEAIGADELRSRAERFLADHCGCTTYYEIEHVAVPEVRCGDVVRYVNERDYERRIDCLCQVEQVQMALTPSGTCHTKLRGL